MKKEKLFAALLLTVFIGVAGAIGIDENEIRINSTVEFENYSGPHSRIDSVESINSIGSSLGNTISKSTEESQNISNNGKYSVIHVIGAEDGNKLDADIFIIEADASVDHIRNLRRIIASYIASAYGYSYSDASTLATFVTVYNAVYRKDLATFTQKYKKEVVQNLSASKCGLSTKWSEWPGNSQIVIPLYDVTKGISTIDTSTISDQQVIDSMREDDDRGVDERKNMVDIKEREADAASDRAQDAAKQAAAEQKALEEQKRQQAEAEQKAADAKEAAEEARADADANPDDAEKQKAAEEAEAKAAEAQEEAEKEAEETQRQKEAADKAKEEAAKEQAFSDKKQTEANSDRKDIAKDQKELANSTPSDADLNLVTGLRLVNYSDNLSTIVKLNEETGSVVKTSPVSVIRGRTLLPVNDDLASGKQGDSTLKYMAVCGENTGNGAIKLCLLDSSTLEITKESEETLAEDSVLVQKGNDYYCVIKDGSNYVVAQYDKKLKLIVKSPVAVKPATPLTVTDQGIIATNASGRAVLLNLKDLTLVTSTASNSKNSNTVPEK